MSGNSKRQPSQTPLQERMEKIAVPYGLDLMGRIDKENRMEEVKASVPLDLLRHIYFALSAAKQKDPDSVQLAYLLNHLNAKWPDCCTKYKIVVDVPGKPGGKERDPGIRL